MDYTSAVGQEWGDVIDCSVICTSPDAITWTVHRMAEDTELNDASWNGSLFIAVGYDGTAVGEGMIYTSPDGTTWTRRTLPTDNDAEFLSVHCASGLCVAVGDRLEESTPSVSTSIDGITWVTRNPPFFPGFVGNFQRIKYKDGLWVAVGMETISINIPLIASSPDGISWTQREMQPGIQGGYFNDVVVAPVSPVEVDTSGWTDQYTFSIWLKVTSGTLWTTYFPGSNQTSIQSGALDPYTWVRSGGLAELVTFGLRASGKPN